MFSLQLTRNVVPPDAKWPDICRKEPSEGERTNTISILADVTDNMELIDMAKFTMTGFDVEWNVDISYDLLSILKELPDLRAWIHDKWEEPFAITMCVSGRFRDIVFNRHDDTLVLTLTDRHDRSNVYGTEVIDIEKFGAMTNQIVNTFAQCTKVLCPNLYDHVWFNDWHAAALINADSSKALSTPV